MVAGWVIGVCFVFWAWEGAIHLKLHGDIIKQNGGDNVFWNLEPDFERWLKESGTSANEFQAVLPIPSFNVGSEKFVPRNPSIPTTSRVFKLAYNTGLPMACGSMSRTSIGQSLNLIQLFSGDYIEKEILDKYPNQKPILILFEENTKITEEEKWLLSKATRITPEGRFGLYRLELDDLKTQNREIVDRFEALRDSALFQQKDFYLSQDSVWFYFDGFDQQEPEFGKETIRGNDQDPLQLFKGKIPAGKYEVSVWMKVDKNRAGFPIVYYQAYHEDGSKGKFYSIPTMFGQTIYRDWMWVDHRFEVDSTHHEIEFFVRERYPEMESFLIRPEDVDIYWPVPGMQTLMYNNFYLER